MASTSASQRVAAKKSAYDPNQDASHVMLRGCVLDYPFLPYAGAKTEGNSGIDFPPADVTGASFPGGRKVPLDNDPYPIFFNTISGQTMSIQVTCNEPIASVRQKIFQKMQAALYVQEHEDDVDARCAEALCGPAYNEARSNRYTIATDETLARPPPGAAAKTLHEPSHPDMPHLRRKYVAPGSWIPPIRTPKTSADLDVYYGLVKLEDTELVFSKGINTGAPPSRVSNCLYTYGVLPGAVLRAQWLSHAGEQVLRRIDAAGAAAGPGDSDGGPPAGPKGFSAQDPGAYGQVDEAGTAVNRVKDTVLNPDFYVSAIEGFPRSLLELVKDPSAEDDSDNPLLGRLEPMDAADRKQAAARAARALPRPEVVELAYRNRLAHGPPGRAAAAAQPQPPQPQPVWATAAAAAPPAPVLVRQWVEERPAPPPVYRTAPPAARAWAPAAAPVVYASRAGGRPDDGFYSGTYSVGGGGGGGSVYGGSVYGSGVYTGGPGVVRAVYGGAAPVRRRPSVELVSV